MGKKKTRPPRSKRRRLSSPKSTTYRLSGLSCRGGTWDGVELKGKVWVAVVVVVVFLCFLLLENDPSCYCCWGILWAYFVVGKVCFVDCLLFHSHQLGFVFYPKKQLKQLVHLVFPVESLYFLMFQTRKLGFF